MNQSKLEEYFCLLFELSSPVVLRGRVFEGVIGRSKCLFFISSSGDPQVPC